MKISEYMCDGAHPQARGVLVALQWVIGDGIESSWNEDISRYDADIQVSRWHNCREQGYIASLYSENRKQLNIAWFEHRNSDSVHAVMWVQSSINPITIENASFGDVYATKWDTSHSVKPGEWTDMAEWIKERFTEHWNENKRRA